MTIRLTTPGVIAAALLALLVGVIMAYEVNKANTVSNLRVAQQNAPGPQTALGAFNPALIFASRERGVVTIQAIVGDPEEPLQGTGFVVDTDGHIVTNFHVIRDMENDSGQAQEIFVENKATGETTTATVVGFDDYNDVAVLKVDASSMRLQPIPWGSSDALAPGEPVATIGAPFNHANSITMGIVSAKTRTVASGIRPGYEIAGAVQTSVGTNRGNSGGALLNGRGEVVGIIQQIGTNPNEGSAESTIYDTGISFAIPVELVRRSVEQIITSGSVSLPRVGLNQMATVSPALARLLHLAKPQGVVVGETAGPAAKAGILGGARSVVFDGKAIHGGDEIVMVAGHKVVTKEELEMVASRLTVGKPVQVVLYHGAERRVVTLTPEARP